jgi:hypothetical protein
MLPLTCDDSWQTLKAKAIEDMEVAKRREGLSFVNASLVQK